MPDLSRSCGGISDRAFPAADLLDKGGKLFNTIPLPRADIKNLAHSGGVGCRQAIGAGHIFYADKIPRLFAITEDGLPSLILCENIEVAVAYSLASCLGPYTLKYLSAVVGTPWTL